MARLRTQTKTPGDMARRAASFLKAGRTLLLEARDSYHHSTEAWRLCDQSQAWAWNEVLGAVGLAPVLDAFDAKRRQKKGRAA